ncbi:MAG: TVP38/TMEM64 family protein [Clostridium sp.]
MKNFFIRNKYKFLFLLAIIGIYLFVEPIRVNINRAIFIMQNVDVELVRGYILGFGVWAPIVSFILMILQSVVAPLPAFIITFANAAIFGWVYGAILSWSSAMAGAALCFFIARLLGRDVVEKLTSKNAVKKADDFFKDYGTYAVLIARLLPFISFDIVSYAAGLTGMRFWSFFIATGIGQLPATLIYSYIGGMLTGTTKTVVTGLLILFAVSTLIILIKKVWGKKSEATSEKAVQ